MVPLFIVNPVEVFHVNVLGTIKLKYTVGPSTGVIPAGNRNAASYLELVIVNLLTTSSAFPS
jgi:hypothetical protein